MYSFIQVCWIYKIRYICTIFQKKKKRFIPYIVTTEITKKQHHHEHAHDQPLFQKENSLRTNAGIYDNIQPSRQAKEENHPGTPISYPSNTSVVLPSQPRFPLVEIINRHAWSMYNWDIVPVRCPGMIRNGTVEWRATCSCFKS